MSQNIHKTAIIEDGAKIGKNVTIGAYSIVGKDVIVGDDTTIDSHCIVDGYTTIGQNNHIFSHSVLGTIPQDLKYDGEKSFLQIGDSNTIREHTLINSGTKGGGLYTKIGNGCLIMGHVHIGHDCILGDNIVVANSCAIAGHVIIEDTVVVGGMSAIHQFCHIGKLAMVGGGSILVQDIPPYCICEGNRAKLRGLNINGLRRRYQDKSIIDAIRKAYKKIFESGKSIAQVSQEILEDNPIDEVRILAKMVVDTKRGIPFKRKENNG